jgi:hypothetical protein
MWRPGHIALGYRVDFRTHVEIWGLHSDIYLPHILSIRYLLLVGWVIFAKYTNNLHSTHPTNKRPGCVSCKEEVNGNRSDLTCVDHVTARYSTAMLGFKSRTFLHTQQCTTVCQMEHMKLVVWWIDMLMWMYLFRQCAFYTMFPS